ncbi:Hint domain-containing protein [Rhizobium cauense]|uniref:Hint domain-containing protein n=1 Tax=Rhizobium cauense TaxID=1166683 RepID=UPI001C6EC6D0|nr:Hint domain-containing protein [Rhizobium cauense]MBW9115588.1 Hint domain-containing protein [Rhizobium cauense]
MSNIEDPKLPRNTARRRFLGVAAAAGARLASATAIAMAATSSPARAVGLHLGWGKGNGNSDGNGRSGDGDGGSPQCFLRGTSILTDLGEKPVEHLQIGDRLVLAGGTTSAVRWVGRQSFKRNGGCWHDSVVPIRVARRALTNLSPHSDLYLSPGHALFLNGVLIRVKDLVNGTTIAPIVPHDDMTIEYFAVLLATHEAIFAEGAAAETFHPSEGGLQNFSNSSEYMRHYASDNFETSMTSFAPVLGEEGGWEHLKALVLLPLVASPDPFEEARMQISLQAKSMEV